MWRYDVIEQNGQTFYGISYGDLPMFPAVTEILAKRTVALFNKTNFIPYA